MKHQLTETDLMILRMYASGLREKEITEAINFTPERLRSRVRRIAATLGVSAKSQAYHYAVLEAIRQGLIVAPIPGAVSKPPVDLGLPNWHKGCAA